MLSRSWASQAPSSYSLSLLLSGEKREMRGGEFRPRGGMTQGPGVRREGTRGAGVGEGGGASRGWSCA
jgi:hypothetical protein